MRMDVYQDTGQRVLYAAEGKTISAKEGATTIAAIGGTIFGPVVWLGKNASEHDFIEVDAPVEEIGGDDLQE